MLAYNEALAHSPLLLPFSVPFASLPSLSSRCKHPKKNVDKSKDGMGLSCSPGLSPSSLISACSCTYTEQYALPWKSYNEMGFIDGLLSNEIWFDIVVVTI